MRHPALALCHMTDAALHVVCLTLPEGDRLFPSSAAMQPAQLLLLVSTEKRWSMQVDVRPGRARLCER